jgi:hypothetical protein
MKLLPVKLGFIPVVIGLIIFGNVEAWGADWKPYSWSETGIYYYDTESIIRPSKNIVRLKSKDIFTNKGIKEAVDGFGKSYANLNYTIDLIEINCEDKMYCFLSSTAYSKEGGILDSITLKGEWHFIAPESIIDALSNAVCK